MTDLTTQLIRTALGLEGCWPSVRLVAAASVVGGPAVTSLGTVDRETLEPVPGGLFDPLLFGVDGARPAALQLVEPVPHPLFAGRLVEVLTVLPPRFRPITQLDGGFVSSDLNVLYLDVLRWNERFTRLRRFELQRPLDDAREHLVRAVARLFDNERQADPADDGAGRRLRSLRGVLASAAGPTPDERARAVCAALEVRVEPA